MSVDVVIARYSEDIQWTQKIPYNVIIYNKGQYLPNTISLSNIGREAHTYLEHIVRNYDTMDPNGVTAFCQGSLADHIQGMPEEVHIQQMVEEALQKGFCESKAHWRDIADIYQPHEHFRISAWPPGYQLIPNKRNETFGRWFRRCTGMTHLPDIMEFKWVIAAIFAVHNSIIKQRSKEYYISLLDEFDDSNAPEIAHFFERSWYYIFKPVHYYINHFNILNQD